MNSDDATPGPPDEQNQDQEYMALRDDFADFLGLVNEVSDRHVPPSEVERRLRRLMNKVSETPAGGNDDDHPGGQPAEQGSAESPDDGFEVDPGDGPLPAPDADELGSDPAATRSWIFLTPGLKWAEEGPASPLVNQYDPETLVLPTVTAARAEADRILAKARRDAEFYTDAALKNAAETVRNARLKADRIISEAKAEAARIRSAAHTSATAPSPRLTTATERLLHGALDAVVPGLATSAASVSEIATAVERLQRAGTSHGDIKVHHLVVGSESEELVLVDLDAVRSGPSAVRPRELRELRELIAALLEHECARPDLISRPHHGSSYALGSYAHFTSVRRDIETDIIAADAGVRLPAWEPSERWQEALDEVRKAVRHSYSYSGYVESVAAAAALPLHRLSPGRLCDVARRCQPGDRSAETAYRVAVVLFSKDRPDEAEWWLRQAYDAGHPGAIDLARHAHPQRAASDVALGAPAEVGPR